MRLDKKLLITDLDNTLFDWFDIWYYPFRGMLDALVLLSGIPESRLKMEIKKVHQRHGTSEYAFLIEELECLPLSDGFKSRVEQYEPAIQVFREERRKHMRLYEGVWDTLDAISADGAMIIGYTESLAFYSGYRVRKLGLDGKLRFLYSPPDHAIPEEIDPESIRKYPSDSYRMSSTQHRHTRRGEVKPNPAILEEIIGAVGVELDEVVYVGDSKVKDVQMAKDLGVTDVHAAYGESHRKEEYELLRDVTHWTAEMVERERNSSGNIEPTFSISEFRDLRDLFSFGDL